MTEYTPSPKFLLENGFRKYGLKYTKMTNNRKLSVAYTPVHNRFRFSGVYFYPNSDKQLLDFISTLNPSNICISTSSDSQ